MDFGHIDTPETEEERRARILSLLTPQRAQIAATILAGMMPREQDALREHTPAMMLNYARRAVDQTDALLACLLQTTETVIKNG